MFLMCPLTPTSPSLCLLLIGHPWWLSHLVLKTVGCILSAQGPLGGYSSSSGLVLGGQGQSLCLSPCPSTLHTSLECSAASPLRKWGTLALLDWNVGFGPSGCLNSMRNECFQTRRAVGFARAAEEGWDSLKNTQVKIHHRQLKEAWLLVKVGAFEKAGRGLKPEINVKHLEQGLLPCFSMPALPAWRYNCRVVHLALFGCGRAQWPVGTLFIYFAAHYRSCLRTCVWGSWMGPPGQQTTHVENVNSKTAEKKQEIALQNEMV